MIIILFDLSLGTAFLSALLYSGLGNGTRVRSQMQTWNFAVYNLSAANDIHCIVKKTFWLFSKV